MDWPNIAIPSFSSSGETYLPTIRDTKESGFVSVRKRFTRSRESFVLFWQAMTEADYQTLRAFFVANQGGVFNYTDPATSTTKAVAFAAESLQYLHLDRGLRRVSVGLEEL
jgi:cystathionine beta-lyase/cystathionine gamma-synthase